MNGCFVYRELDLLRSLFITRVVRLVTSSLAFKGPSREQCCLADPIMNFLGNILAVTNSLGYTSKIYTCKRNFLYPKDA